MLKSCFFISRIGRAASPERAFSDKLLRWIIEPALEGLGYEKPVRADHITEPGIITRQIFERLWSDDLVVADLTGGNPNVFYELAVRHVTRKPCVHLIETGGQLPFDVAPSRAIEFAFEVEAAAVAKELLRVAIQQAEALLEHETPLSMAIDRPVSLGRVQPEQPTISDILSTVKETRNLVESQSRSGITIRWQREPVSAQRTEKASPQDPRNVVAPVLIEQIEPEYPHLARAARVQGTIRLQLRVGCDGIVKDSRLISGLPLLASAAQSAVHNWKYQPGTDNGEPAESTQIVDIRFTLPT